MHPALRLLIWLRFRATIRQLLNGLKTPKGAVIGMVVLISFGFMMIPLLVGLSVPNVEKLAGVEQIRHYIPLALFGYMILSLFTSLGSDSFSFSLEEIENLFPAPFSRKQLLIYKIQSVLRMALISSMFMTVASASLMPNFLRGFLGIYSTVLLAILFPMFLTLLGQIGSSQLFNQRRKLAAIALSAGLLIAAVQGIKQLLQAGISAKEINEWVAGITDSTLGSILLAPFKVFAEVIFSPAFDLAFFGNLAIAIGINTGLLFLIFRLDANYLAVVERTAFKVAEMQKNIRSTGGMAWKTRKEYSGKFPMLPFFDGMGPIIWRQLLVTYRLTKWLIIVSLLLMGLVAVPLLFEGKKAIGDTPFVPVIAFMGIGYMSLFFTLSAPVGFRPDLHRMEVFKCLPLSNASIALGQLLGSVIILVGIQLTVIGLFAVFTPKLMWIWAIAFIAILPINYLAMGVTNTLSLLFPVKSATGAKDLPAVGQGILLMFSLLITIAILMTCVFGSAAICFLFTENWVLTVSLGASIAIAFCVAISFALIKAYERFDVSLNSPS